MKISKKSQYGLRAMAYLANNERKFWSIREISEKEGISFNYLEKILSIIEKGGLLKSKKGIQGGYTLAKNPQEITVGEILKTLEGKMSLTECLGVESCAKEKICKTKKVWKKIQESIEETINSITLKDLI